ncbi:MAG: TonB-dependent receptor [Gammaproteobacteria bacterium]|jgi:iron complex outermembrane receptor protein|nr:TonB-dependent receptor [Gammaproteobacteria bacterium]MBT4194638.1 TonB-dependent receptor [Gammaproteobacteria bacterium]MBT6702208.1 TonB-dependent receptor [Gammaproteobacteria bacterium]MBT7206695.1 TonB-dependent receptor [Gammaproteobacteria bacterium]
MAIKAICAGVMVTGVALNGVALAADDDAVELKKEVSTGSHIKRTDIESAQPLIVIDAEEIANRGYVTVQDALNSLTQNAGGSLTQQSIHGFTPAASGFDLRGAGLGRVLTLIDGKRVSKYPIAAGAEINFVDTANIPIGAIERIEILAGGASAIYGSDAMGGVVNIIMRKDFEGIEATLYESTTDNGGRDVHRQSAMWGVSGDWGNATVFLEHEEREQLKATDRSGFDIGTDLAFDHPFSSYSSYGGSLFLYDGATSRINTIAEADCKDRGLQWRDTFCGFDRTTMRDLLPEQERTSIMGNFSFNLSEDHELYGRFDSTSAEIVTRIEPMPVADYTYYTGAAYGVPHGMVGFEADATLTYIERDITTGFGGDFADYAGTDAVTDPDQDGIFWYTRRMIEFGNRMNTVEVDNTGFSLGAKGVLTDAFEYDATFTLSEQEVVSRGNGYATVDGFFDLIAGTDDASSISQLDYLTADQVATAAYETYNKDTSSYQGISFGVNGDLLEMEAGALSIAFGVELGTEEFTQDSDTASADGEILSTGGATPSSGERDSKAIYAEALIPVSDELIIKPALRFDDYSDAGSHVSPQLGFEFRPDDNLLVRANWAGTFRAPDMMRVYGGEVTAFQQIIDPKGCEDGGGTIGVGSPGVDDVTDACIGEWYVDVFSGSNPDLEPETGENFSFGFVWDKDDFNYSIDIWTVKVNDIVNTLGAQNIANNYETYADLITRDINGLIESVDERPQNLSKLETRGIDMAVGYSVDLDASGELIFDFSTTFMQTYETQSNPTSEVADNIALSNVPTLRANLATTWKVDDALSATLFIQHIGSMNGVNIDLFGGDESYGPLQIQSYTVANVSAKYVINDNFTVRGGINNVLDKGPNPDTTDFGWPHYPREYYSPVGREFKVSLSMEF